MKVVFKKKYSYCFDRINPTTFIPMQEAEIDDSLAKLLIKKKICGKVKAAPKKEEIFNHVEVEKEILDSEDQLD